MWSRFKKIFAPPQDKQNGYRRVTTEESIVLESKIEVKVKPQSKLHKEMRRVIQSHDEMQFDILFDQIKNFNCKHFSGNGYDTLLIFCTKKNFVHGVKELIQNKDKVNLNSPDSSGNTAMSHAAEDEDVTILQCLIDAGADVNKANNNNWTPLNSAAYEGHLLVVEALIKANANVDTPNNNNWTPLNSAAYEGHLLVVEALIKANANVDTPNANGCTSLNSAANKGHSDGVEALIQAKADIKTPNQFGDTALHFACYNRNTEMITLLMQHGPDLNAQNSKGNIPFLCILEHPGLSFQEKQSIISKYFNLDGVSVIHNFGNIDGVIDHIDTDKKDAEMMGGVIDEL